MIIRYDTKKLGNAIISGLIYVSIAFISYVAAGDLLGHESIAHSDIEKLVQELDFNKDGSLNSGELTGLLEDYRIEKR